MIHFQRTELAEVVFISLAIDILCPSKQPPSQVARLN
jgi:hypothetical protein